MYVVLELFKILLSSLNASLIRIFPVFLHRLEVGNCKVVGLIQSLPQSYRNDVSSDFF